MQGEKKGGRGRAGQTRWADSGSLTRSKSLMMKGATPSACSWRKRDSTVGRGDGWRANGRGDVAVPAGSAA